MAEAAIFPAYIRAEYQESSDGLPAFSLAISETLNKARRTTEISMDQIQRTIANALSGNMPDLGLGELRAAATAAEARATASRQMAAALQQAAAAEGNYSVQAQVAIGAAQRLAAEEEQAALAARLNADAIEYMANAGIKATAASGTALAATNRATQASLMAAKATGAQRQASLMLGQQLQDVAIQAQLGVNPLIILTQQGSQAAFAFANLEGKVGAFARGISHPAVAAILIGVSALAALIGKTEDTADALDKVHFSSDAVGNAQNILGGIVDLTTGKFKAQREELVALAIAQAKVAAIQAKARADTLRQEVTSLQDPTTKFSGGIGGGFNIERRPAGAVGAISRDVLAGTLDTTTAIDRLDNLRKVGVLTDETFAKAAKSVSGLGVELANIKTYQGAERLLRGVGTGSDRALLLRPSKPKADHSAEKANRLSEFGSDTRDAVMAINREWDAQPRLIDRAGNAMDKLNDLAEDLAERKPKGWQDMLEVIEQTRDVVKTGLEKPYNDLVESQEQQLQIGKLVLGGRQDEADALGIVVGLERQMGPLTEAQRQHILNNVEATRLLGRETEILRRQQSAYLDAISTTRDSIRQAFVDIQGHPGRAISGLIDRATDTAKNLFAERLTQKLFDGMFDKLGDQVLGRDKLTEASDQAATALDRLANAADRVVARATGASANDNSLPGEDGPPIEVMGKPLRAASGFLKGYEDTLHGIANPLKDGFKKLSSDLDGVFDKVFGKSGSFSETMGGLFASAQVGATAGGLLLGSGNNRLGSAVGGALGNEVGKALGKGAFGKVLGNLSSALGPLGSIAGGILGGALGGLLGGTKKGSATIGANASGELVVTGFSGNSASRQKAAGEGANSAISTLTNIAEALGGTLNAAAGSVSIGIRKGSYRVDPTGGGATKIKKGAIDFGEDAAAAVKYATLNLIQDGVIAGLKASTQRLLQSGTDLDAALQKALDFESIFTRLKAYTDPVGAALDSLDKEFSHLKAVSNEAGASAEEYAKLERLYGIERAAAIREAGEKTVASLKSLLADLTTNNSALSLRTRQGTAQKDYDALEARVKAGDVTAYDDFATAASTLLDIQRQISGSTYDYFKLLDEVISLTQSRIDAETNVSTISAARPGLFGATTSAAASTAADVAPVVSALEYQTTYLKAQNDNTSKLVRQNETTISQNAQIISLLAAAGGYDGSNF